VIISNQAYIHFASTIFAGASYFFIGNSSLLLSQINSIKWIPS